MISVNSNFMYLTKISKKIDLKSTNLSEVVHFFWLKEIWTKLCQRSPEIKFHTLLFYWNVSPINKLFKNRRVNYFFVKSKNRNAGSHFHFLILIMEKFTSPSCLFSLIDTLFFLSRQFLTFLLCFIIFA